MVDLTTSEMDTKYYVKKPVLVRAIQMHEPFQVQTKEGLMTGKSGDWFMIGVENERYICADSIFQKTYEEFAIGEDSVDE